MAQQGGQGLVRLRRHNTGVPWGFRMHGGRDFGNTPYVQQVTPNSIAHRAGLRTGDAILQIGRVPTGHMNHEQVKMEIIRSGNDVDFIIDRNAIDVVDTAPPASPTEPRAQVVEESCRYRSEPTNEPQVQSRSFHLLQMSLQTAQPQEAAHSNAVSPARHTSRAQAPAPPHPPLEDLAISDY